MEKNFLICLFLIQLSCDQMPVNEVTLPPEDETLIGVWHEIAPKAMVLDGAGNIIDSIDISATYDFNDDYTFTALNDTWANNSHGTWAFDTIYDRLNIYPVDDAMPTAYRLDTWEIITFSAQTLVVGHTFDYVFPDQSVGAIYLKRKFVKVE